MPNASTSATCKPNAGGFRKGGDPRRQVHSATCGHRLYRFTPEDCSKGFWTAIAVLGVSIGPKLHHAGRWPGFQKQGRRRAR